MSYPKEIVSHATQIMAKRREEAMLHLAERRGTIEREVPEAMLLEKQIASTSARLCKAILSGENVEQKVQELKRFNLGAQKELADLLQSHGFSLNDLQLQPSCALCQDTGFHDGRRCSCMTKLLKDLMYERLGNDSRAQAYGFDKFSLSYYSDQFDQAAGAIPARVMAHTLEECVKYAKGFSLSSGNLLLTGGPGLGKTHLSLSIAAAVVERGYDVLYTPFHTLISRLEAVRFSRGNDEYHDYIEAPLSCELLILDDLGAEFTTSFTISVLYDLINARQISGRPTIINSNLSLHEMEQRYSKRITSRLAGGYRILPFIGRDIRLLTSPNR